MNILFLVFGFILIFLFFSSTLLQQAIFFSSEQKNSMSYVEGKVKIHDKFERYKYKTYDEKIKSVKSKGSPQKIKSKKEGSYLSHRIKGPFSSQGKWNLAPLIFAKQQPDSLESSTILFLESLYGHTNFWKEAKKQMPELAKALLLSFKEHKEVEKLSDLFPTDPPLKFVFYKMLKGSGHYDVTLKQGYPPLEDFFRLKKENTHTLSLPYASFFALKALLGEDLSLKILEIEKSKWEAKGGYYSISNEEFTSLITRYGALLPIQEINHLLQKDHKKVRLEKITHKEGKRAYLQIPIS